MSTPPGGTGGARFVAAAIAAVALTFPAAEADTVRWILSKPGAAAGHPIEILGAPRVVQEQGEAALEFDGTQDGLLVPVNPIAGWRVFTIEALVRPAPGGAFEQRFLHLGEPNGSRALLELRLQPDGHWYLDTFIKSGEHQQTLLDASKRHPVGAWRWVALRYDGARMAHFVDGSLEAEHDLAMLPMPAGQTAVGVRMTRVSWFKGQLREVRFHDSVLPASALQR